MRRFAAGLALMSLAAAFTAPAAPLPERIDAARLSEITRVLASDEFEGRAPGSAGEQRTIDYLIAEFRALGLQPAGEHGSWTQRVPLLHTQAPADARITVHSSRGSLDWRQGQEIATLTLRPVDRVQLTDAELVFVGYGVTAPERNWDDYRGSDMRGKVAVILINDPDFEAVPGDAAYGRFDGNAATYYARWTYKYEEAVRHGAIGALVVHETAGAGYPWSTAIAANGEGYDIVRTDPAAEKLLFQSWLARDAAIQLFRSAGLDFEALKVAARRTGFKPVPIAGARLSIDHPLQHSRIESRNVLAQIKGSKRPAEFVMVAAHWDAYGIGAPDADGRRIRPGAIDDAIGVAGVLEVARVLRNAARPQRSVIFAAWTAEERGLLGSEYYAVNPVQPLATMAANLTIDVLQTAGPARDVVLIGAGQSELDDYLAQAAASQQRTVTPDAKPERALAFRADHFSLAKRGVPALLLMGIGGGVDLINGGRTAGDRFVSDYTTRCYHKTCDQWSNDWDLRGAVQDVELVLTIARQLANSRAWPRWREGLSFKTVRDESAPARERAAGAHKNRAMSQ